MQYGVIRKEYQSFSHMQKNYMHQYIISEVREFNRIGRAESTLSFDQPVKTEANTESIGNVFFQIPGDFVNSVILRDFLNCLENELKLIAWLYIENYSSEEIMHHRNITKINMYCGIIWIS